MVFLRSFIVLIFAFGAFVSGCDKRPGDSQKNSAAAVGTSIDDSVVTTKVKSALFADPEVKSFDIKVETRKGVVQLSGFVDNQTRVERALDIARRVEGVKSVENHMTFKGGSSSAGEVLDDSVITSKIKSSFLANSEVKGLDIGVVTNKGVVQLSGFAESRAQMDRAIQIAGNVEGVKSVTNKMSVKK